MESDFTDEGPKVPQRSEASRVARKYGLGDQSSDIEQEAALRYLQEEAQLNVLAGDEQAKEKGRRNLSLSVGSRLGRKAQDACRKIIRGRTARARHALELWANRSQQGAVMDRAQDRLMDRDVIDRLVHRASLSKMELASVAQRLIEDGCSEQDLPGPIRLAARQKLTLEQLHAALTRALTKMKNAAVVRVLVLAAICGLMSMPTGTNRGSLNDPARVAFTEMRSPQRVAFTEMKSPKRVAFTEMKSPKRVAFTEMKSTTTTGGQVAYADRSIPSIDTEMDSDRPPSSAS